MTPPKEEGGTGSPAAKKLPLRILLTNDDGIHAPGLKALEKIAKELSDDVWVVAPETEQSGASHSLTLNDILRTRQLSKRHFAVRGTPADCVVMGVRNLITDKPPDLIMSGVNRGSNIADDITYSGTIAGAMEGTLMGFPSIALSQAYGFSSTRDKVKWSTAEHHGPELVRRLLDQGWPSDVLININFPDVAHSAVEKVEVTVQGKRDQSNLAIDERKDGRGNPYYWLGFAWRLSNPPEGTDLKAIYSNRISVTPLHLNLTHKSTQSRLKKVLDGAPPAGS